MKKISSLSRHLTQYNNMALGYRAEGARSIKMHEAIHACNTTLLQSRCLIKCHGHWIKEVKEGLDDSA